MAELGWPDLTIGAVEGRNRAGRWESSSTTVCFAGALHNFSRLTKPGVDACNTVFEVVLFAAAMNLGQGWSTFMVLVGG